MVLISKWYNIKPLQPVTGLIGSNNHNKAGKALQEQTSKAASIKAWRITTKAGKALQEISKEMAAGKGYEIATDAEILAKYGDLCNGFKYAKVRDNKPRIWCIYTCVADYRGRVSLSVVCVR